MNFDCVFINGDCYSAPNKDFAVYGEHISQSLKLPLVNLAAAGSSNDRILRSSIEFVESKKFQNPLIIVAWTFIRRIELWYHGDNQRIIRNLLDQTPEEYKSPRFVTLDWLLDVDEATVAQQKAVNDESFVHKHLTNFYTDLFLFSHYLQQQNLRYFFFSGAKNNEIPINCFPAIENLNLVQQVSNDKNIYQLHSFFIEDWAKENDPDHDQLNGNLSAQGHKDFAKHLLTLLPL
jgi:hypothetical protein